MGWWEIRWYSMLLESSKWHRVSTFLFFFFFSFLIWIWIWICKIFAIRDSHVFSHHIHHLSSKNIYGRRNMVCSFNICYSDLIFACLFVLFIFRFGRENFEYSQNYLTSSEGLINWDILRYSLLLCLFSHSRSLFSRSSFCFDFLQQYSGIWWTKQTFISIHFWKEICKIG